MLIYSERDEQGEHLVDTDGDFFDSTIRVDMLRDNLEICLSVWKIYSLKVSIGREERWIEWTCRRIRICIESDVQFPSCIVFDGKKLTMCVKSTWICVRGSPLFPRCISLACFSMLLSHSVLLDNPNPSLYIDKSIQIKPPRLIYGLQRTLKGAPREASNLRNMSETMGGARRKNLERPLNTTWKDGADMKNNMKRRRGRGRWRDLSIGQCGYQRDFAVSSVGALSMLVAAGPDWRWWPVALLVPIAPLPFSNLGPGDSACTIGPLIIIIWRFVNWDRPLSSDGVIFTVAEWGTTNSAPRKRARG